MYCSRTKPAIVAEKDGPHMAFDLALLSTREGVRHTRERRFSCPTVRP